MTDLSAMMAVVRGGELERKGTLIACFLYRFTILNLFYLFIFIFIYLFIFTKIVLLAGNYESLNSEAIVPYTSKSVDFSVIRLPGPRSFHYA